MNKSFVTSFLITSLLCGILVAQQSDIFQVEWVQDTIALEKGDSVFMLSHRFIITGSERLSSDKGPMKEYRIESIAGRVELPTPIKQSLIIIASYHYLVKPFQTKYTSAISTLPRLEDLQVKKQEEVENVEPIVNDNISLVADGTIFRGITISPLGGASLNGGLRFSLQGNITDDMMLTGTLSDQNSPIQPEGNTQTLNEIDKVYLEVTHPFAKIVAGDIDMRLDEGQLLTLSRRLQGLKVRLGSNQANLNAVVASSKGKYHSTEFLGEDQNQGPYSLYSENGVRGIVIMGGSEKVWLNGNLIVRGENNDYTIDYSQGEITFTPRHAIDSNSRIYVEYEYSDFVYPREVASASFKRMLSDNRSSTSLSWVREGDNVDSQLAFALNSEERDLLKLKGDEKTGRSTAVIDSTGNYIMRPNPDKTSDFIFIYVPDDQKYDEETYYRVTFHNIGTSGDYSRKVTSDSKIYFEYVPPTKRGNKSDLYVPWRMIIPPQSHHVTNLNTHLYLSDSSLISLEMASSIRDKNLLSEADDKDNKGFAGLIQFSHSQALPGEAGIISLSASVKGLRDHFFPIQRDESIEFSREWNLIKSAWELAEETGEARNVSEIKVDHRLDRRLKTSASIGAYSDIFQSSRRLRANTSFVSQWMPEFRIDFTEVDRTKNGSQRKDFNLRDVSGKSTWRRLQVFSKFVPGKIHPYIRYEEEEKSADFRFEEMAGGLLGNTEHFQGNIGLIRRFDLGVDTSMSSWLKVSESWLGELDLSGRWRSGYRFNLVAKNRLKYYADGRDNLNYNLARGSFGYNPRRGAFRGNFDFKIEQTLYEEKIVIYDSVGVGRGSYRYDPNYGTYFSDPNGEFIALYISSGKRTPSSHLSTGLKISVDFKRYEYPLLRHVKWRLLANTDFNGRVLNPYSILRPSISQDGIHRARINIQNDFNYVPRKTRRRVRLSSNHRKEVIGIGFQGSSQQKHIKYSFTLEEPLTKVVTLVSDGTVHDNGVESSIASRVRDVKGWFLNSGIRWRSSRVLEVGSDFRVGRDRGENIYETFSTRLTGIGVHVLIFPHKGGRIEGSIDYYNITSPVSLASTLPPEAAQGMQVGNTLRTRVTTLLILGQNLSVNAHLSYIIDPIHDGILTLNGEVRATF